MSERYRGIVVGIGAMGSAALYRLAKRRKKSLGLKRFYIPSDRRSSHGITRLIRLADFEMLSVRMFPSTTWLRDRVAAEYRSEEASGGSEPGPGDAESGYKKTGWSSRSASR